MRVLRNIFIFLRSIFSSPGFKHLTILVTGLFLIVFFGGKFLVLVGVPVATIGPIVWGSFLVIIAIVGVGLVIYALFALFDI
jgi:hypothetical protein